MTTTIPVGKTNLAILRGELDVSTWSDEELRRGQRRDRNGNWGGRPPKIVPKAIHDELAKRTYDEASRIMKDNLVDAVTLFGDIVRNENVDMGVRLKAATVIVDRVLGRAPLTVQVDLQPKWQAAIAHAVVSIPGDVLEQHAIEVHSRDTTES